MWKDKVSTQNYERDLDLEKRYKENPVQIGVVGRVVKYHTNTRPHIYEVELEDGSRFFTEGHGTFNEKDIDWIRQRHHNFFAGASMAFGMHANRIWLKPRLLRWLKYGLVRLAECL